MDVLNHPVHEETANKTQPEGTTYENDLLSTKLEEKFIDLLYEMSRALKYNFDKVHLSKSIYMPVAFSNILIENNTIRSSIIDILEGRRTIKMDITSLPDQGGEITKEVEMFQSELRKFLLDLMEGNQAIPISTPVSQGKKRRKTHS